MSAHPDTSTVTRPLFVIGTGRCGLSPVMDLLTAHEDLAWCFHLSAVGTF